MLSEEPNAGNEGSRIGKPHGILIFGANGSGKTTLGHELARILIFKHMDIEAYAFEESEIPYTNQRPKDACVQLMLADIMKVRSFVISAVTGDFGDTILPMFDLAVWISAPKELRIKRIEQRASMQHGERVLEGGDMYDQHREFIHFAKSRSLSAIDRWAETIPCPVFRIDGMADYRQTAADIANRFYTKPGEPWRVRVEALGELQKYRFTVIFARHKDKWLYARHKDRETFETAGGHIELGESPLDCAKRELYEETGATKFSIYPAFDYAVHRDTEFSYGQVFYADVEAIGELPESEMAEVRAFSNVPDQMTYSAVLPVLYGEMLRWLEHEVKK